MCVLQKRIGYSFKNPDILSQALTHASFGQHNNERLEFVGDRVLNLVVAELLFEMFDKVPEGTLAKRHATLVCGKTLVLVAGLWDVAPSLVLGEGEKRGGGREKESILADCVEAILAAIYFDGGFDVVRGIIRRTWEPLVETVQFKDNKTLLQEWLQARGDGTPDYRLLDTKGEAHKMIFKMQVFTKNYGSAEGQGTSKQQAQQQAAGVLLAQLEKKDT